MQMSTKRLLWALLLFHASGQIAPARDVIAISDVSTRAPRLHVDIVFDGPPMPPRVAASAIEEITLIWGAYGVDIQTLKAGDVRRHRAVGLAVKLVDHPDREVATRALGSIVFLDDVPEPAIVMYPNTIAALVSTATFHGNDDHHWPSPFRDLVVGRALGRALAHEIGHFLLRSRHHSGAGLMRAIHSVADLISPDRRRFVLSATEVKRLVSLLNAEPA